MDFQGRVAMVTGGTGALGSAVVLDLAGSGARVAVPYTADELKGFNIHAHCILPGTMDTQDNRRDMPKADLSPWVATADVARVIRFLLSDDASAVRSVAVPVMGPG